MAEICIHLSARDMREIERLGRAEGERLGALSPVTVAEMAQELLRSHLTLIRDCPGILPERKSERPAPHIARAVVGLGGVSLGGGIHDPN